MVKAKYFAFSTVPYSWSNPDLKVCNIISSIWMERFNNCNWERQSNSQFIDFFFLSVNLGNVLTFSGTTIDGNYTLFSLFFPPLPSPLQVVPFSFFWKKRSLWMPAMNILCCERSLPKDSGFQSLIQLFYNSASYNSFTFLPVPVEYRDISSTFPTSTCLSHADRQNREGSGTVLEKAASLQPA